MQAVWKYMLENEPFGGTRTDVDFQSLYQPGLVQKRGRPYIRDSSDGVILVKDRNDKRADPVEVKARVSANTFHRTVNRFNLKHGIADMPGLGREACEVRCYQLKDDDMTSISLALYRSPMTYFRCCTMLTLMKQIVVTMRSAATFPCFT